MRFRTSLTLGLLLCHSCLAAFGQDAGATDRAAKFASDGMSPTLSVCKLPVTCSGQPPLRATKVIRQTGNDDLVDHRHLTFRGLEVSYLYLLGNDALPPQKRLYPNAYSRPIVLEVTVSSPNWPVSNNLRIGTPRASVERVLGSGSAISDECVSYVNEASQDEAPLCYAHAELKSIKWVKWRD